jgi:hypothetical protein
MMATGCRRCASAPIPGLAGVEEVDNIVKAISMFTLCWRPEMGRLRPTLLEHGVLPGATF